MNLTTNPRTGSSARRGRFVILIHERPDGEVHYDLLLGLPGETGCYTWRFLRPPARRAEPCRRIFDHPLRFLSYEGPLREGRGRVRRYDAGECLLLGDPERGLVLTLQGKEVTGTFRLTRTSESAPSDSEHRGQEGDYLWHPKG